MNILETVGRASCEHARSLYDSVVVLGETVVSALGMLRHPRRFRFGDSMLAFERAALNGLPVNTGIGFLLGTILSFQSAGALKMFGADTFVADLLAIAIFRELGPLVTAIVLAGRSGSAFAAEIGTMKVDEELDALTTMGLPPVRFLMMPRIVAATLAMPILTIFSEIASMLGGAIVMSFMGIPTEIFWSKVCAITTVSMVSIGLAKSCLFGVLVGFIGCCAGMRTKSTADGVGVSATSAVVGGMVAIAVTDGILAVFCYVWGI